MKLNRNRDKAQKENKTKNKIKGKDFNGIRIPLKKLNVVIMLFLALLFASKELQSFTVSKLDGLNAAVEQKNTQVADLNTQMTMWNSNKISLEYIKNNYPKEDLPTSILSFGQYTVDYSNSSGLVISDINLLLDSLQMTESNKLVKINVQAELVGPSTIISDYLKYMSNFGFIYPVSIISKDNIQGGDTAHEIGFELWALNKINAQSFKSPQDITDLENTIKLDFIGKFTDETELRRKLQNFVTSGNVSDLDGVTIPAGETTQDSGISIEVEGLTSIDSSSWGNGELDVLDIPVGNTSNLEDVTESVIGNTNPQQTKPSEPIEEPLPTPSSQIKKLPISGNIITGFSSDHNGIDIETTVGTSIYPVSNGKILFAGEVPALGKTIIIEHNGMVTMYAHLSQINVTSGNVTMETVIGLSGINSNNVPALHFGKSVNNVFVNPIE